VRRLAAFVTIAALVSPVTAESQSLRERFTQLFTFADCGQPLCLDVTNDHGDHFNPALQEGQADLFGFLTNAISFSLSNSVPFTAASSGVTFRFEGGAPVATSVSAGPIFAERSQTLGRGRLLVGANVSNLSFSRFRGTPLDQLEFAFTHQNVGNDALGDPTFENDVIEVATDLDLSIFVTSVYASYGLTDRVDVSVAVPIVRSSLSGTSVARVDFWETPTPHPFDESGSLQASTTVDGSATGIGDIGIRMKANLEQGEASGFALVGDVRLPTGDEGDFHGSGEVAVRVLGAYSGRFEAFSPHLNGGFAYRGGESQTSSALFTVGFDHLMSESVTLAVEVLGDFQVGDPEFTVPTTATFDAPIQRTVDLANIPVRDDHFVNGSIGFKWVTSEDTHLLTNVQLPLSDGGLSPDFIWTVGLARTF